MHSGQQTLKAQGGKSSGTCSSCYSFQSWDNPVTVQTL